MNRNLKEDLDEKNIRKLFGEMRQQDEQIAPPFSAVLQIRPSTGERRIHIGRVLSLSAAILFLILIGGAAIVHFRHSRSREVTVEVNDKKKEQIADRQPIEPESNPQEKRRSSRRVTKRLTKKRSLRTDSLISQWRSPTDFLLRTPGNELLRNVPRLDDSRLKISLITPNQLN